jgi:hypothetical protein
MHDAAALPRLSRLLHRDRPLVLRRRLVSAIADVGGAAAVNPLMERLSDGDASIRAIAAWNLGKTGGSRADVLAALRRLAANNAASAAERGNANAAIAHLASAARTSDFLSLHLVDHDGTALPETAVRVTLPDGTTVFFWSDGRGDVREELLPSGNCDVDLADLTPRAS